MPKFVINSSSITIVSDDDLIGEDLSVDIDLILLKKIYISIGNEGWSLMSIKNFTGDLRLRTPHLKNLYLEDFEDWDITALPSTLTSLELFCYDNSLDLEILNLQDLVNINYFCISNSNIRYEGNTLDELLQLPESYHYDDFGDEDLNFQSLDLCQLALHSSFFKYKLDKKESYRRGATIGAMSDGALSKVLDTHVTAEISSFLTIYDGGRIAQVSKRASNTANNEVKNFVSSYPGLFSSNQLEENNENTSSLENQLSFKRRKI